jgi:hypothetical protein
VVRKAYEHEAETDERGTESDMKAEKDNSWGEREFFGAFVE